MCLILRLWSVEETPFAPAAFPSCTSKPNWLCWHWSCKKQQRGPIFVRPREAIAHTKWQGNRTDWCRPGKLKIMHFWMRPKTGCSSLSKFRWDVLLSLVEVIVLRSCGRSSEGAGCEGRVWRKAGGDPKGDRQKQVLERVEVSSRFPRNSYIFFNTFYLFLTFSPNFSDVSPPCRKKLDLK